MFESEFSYTSTIDQWHETLDSTIHEWNTTYQSHKLVTI